MNFLVNEAGSLNRLCDKRRVNVNELARIEHFLDERIRSGEVDFANNQKELNFILKAILNSQLERARRG